jgi:hypothetical protein
MRIPLGTIARVDYVWFCICCTRLRNGAKSLSGFRGSAGAWAGNGQGKWLLTCNTGGIQAGGGSNPRCVFFQQRIGSFS